MTFYDILCDIGSQGKIVTTDGEFSEKMMIIPFSARENDVDIEMSEVGFTDSETFLLIMSGDAPEFDKKNTYIELDGREYELMSVRRFYVEGRAEHMECIVREREAPSYE